MSKDVADITWKPVKEITELTPAAFVCGACYLNDETGEGWQKTKSVYVWTDDSVVEHKRLDDFKTACGKSFDELSLMNFEIKR